MSEFKHIIITRFNLSKRWDIDKFGNKIINDVWLKDRYQLFESYCLPSIMNQTNKSFEWWVYFDKNLNQDYRDKNKDINHTFPNFIPKYEDSYDDFEKNSPKDLYKDLTIEKKDWLITTRLDNDDMLANNTVELIQNNFKKNSMTLLEIPFGYTLQVSEINSLRNFKSYLNPFISLIENVAEDKMAKSVFYYQHNQWKSIKSITISKKPQWIQIIHDKNVFNRANGTLTYSFNILKRFNFYDKEIKFESISTVIIKRLKKKLRKIKNKIISR